MPDNELALLLTYQNTIHETLDRLGVAAGHITNRLEQLVATNAKLQAFKTYVHKRLDEAGVPENPDPDVTNATGCRIGPRLDLVTSAWVRRSL